MLKNRQVGILFAKMIYFLCVSIINTADRICEKSERSFWIWATYLQRWKQEEVSENINRMLLDPSCKGRIWNRVGQKASEISWYWRRVWRYRALRTWLYRGGISGRTCQKREQGVLCEITEKLRRMLQMTSGELLMQMICRKAWPLHRKYHFDG